MNRRDFIRVGSILIPIILLPRFNRAQTVLTADGIAAFKKRSSGGGGGGAVFSKIVSTSIAGSTGDTTTSGVVTVGANLIILTANYSGGTPPTVTDSKGNTWTTAIDASLGGGNPRALLVYCISPTVGSGHTFTATAVSGFSPSIQVVAFARSGGAPTFHTVTHGEVDSNNWGAGSGVKPGSITPSTSSSLFFTCVFYDVPSSSGIAINSSFTMPESPAVGAFGIQSGYKIKSSDSTAEDPIWTAASSNADVSCAMIDFN